MRKQPVPHRTLTSHRSIEFVRDNQWRWRDAFRTFDWLALSQESPIHSFFTRLIDNDPFQRHKTKIRGALEEIGERPDARPEDLSLQKWLVSSKTLDAQLPDETFAPDRNNWDA